ncbi:hypothetical protein EK21DRAFT_119406 [Setomelanomma holmii]|uniref:Uncharacterized protein n=1 Tax=Setomelanomma holmii TaxID=210430 RepID=A0A9P4LE19_9PLEO|nr:hypothetical protein EK21DRAFT_119406 [Setomelanomma holmii]
MRTIALGVLDALNLCEPVMGLKMIVRLLDRLLGPFFSSSAPVPAPHPASIPPADGIRLLLDLPAELRNIIYEYALTYDGGIVSARLHPRDHGYGDFEQFIKGRHTMPNEIPFELVCQQLRAETRGVVLRVNTVNITNEAISEVSGLSMDSVDLRHVQKLYEHGIGCYSALLKDNAKVFQQEKEEAQRRKDNFSSAFAGFTGLQKVTNPSAEDDLSFVEDMIRLGEIEPGDYSRT